MSHQHEHGTSREASEEDIAKIRDLVKDVKICMLTTTDSEGMLVSRPMSTQEIEFDGAAWFFASSDAPKVAEIEADPHVNAAYSEGAYVSMSGHADRSMTSARPGLATARPLCTPGNGSGCGP